MTQEPRALQSMAPIRHSTYHRISGAILLLPIAILLSGCPQWGISKILVNPPASSRKRNGLPSYPHVSINRFDGRLLFVFYTR
jgi:hypothetical protein